MCCFRLLSTAQPRAAACPPLSFPALNPRPNILYGYDVSGIPCGWTKRARALTGTPMSFGVWLVPSKDQIVRQQGLREGVGRGAVQGSGGLALAFMPSGFKEVVVCVGVWGGGLLQ